MSASEDGIRTWDLDAGRSRRLLRGRSVHAVALAPDGRHLAMTVENRVVVRSLAPDGWSRSIPAPRPVTSVAFSADGRRVLTTGRDVRIWRARGGGRPIVLQEPEGGVFTARFAPQGRRIVTAGQDGSVRLWDVTARQAVLTLPGKAIARDVVFSGDGSFVAGIFHDGTARVWVASARATAAFPGIGLRHAAFSPDGRGLLGVGDRGTVWTWSERAGPRLHAGHSGTVYSGAFSPDGSVVVTTGDDGTTRRWAVWRDGPSRVLARGGLALDVDLDAAGRAAIATPAKGTLDVIDRDSGARRIRLRRSPFGPFSTAFMPDGEHVVSGHADGAVLSWNLATRRTRLIGRHVNRVYTVDPSPDGRYVLTAGQDGTARIWHASGGLAATLVGHRGSVNSAVFSHDGRFVLTAGRDGSVRLWEWRRGGVPAVIERDLAGLQSAAFAPDDRRIVIAHSSAVLVVACTVCRPIRDVFLQAQRRLTRIRGLMPARS